MIDTTDTLKARITELETQLAALQHEYEVVVASRAHARAEWEKAAQENVRWRDPSWRFIPCAERLPAQGVRVLVHINGTVKIAKYWKVLPQWETEDGLYYHGDTFAWVTGWLPLPEIQEDGEA